MGSRRKADGADQPRGAQGDRPRGGDQILRKRVRVSPGQDRSLVDLALMVYDSEADEEAKLVGEGPAIHHFGIEVDDHQGFAEKVVANGGKILSKPGEVPIKYRAPDGTVAEIVPKGRYEKMRDKQP